MWNNFSVALVRRKFVYFAGLLLVSTLFLGFGKAIALDNSVYNGTYWSPNHLNITDNVYMQHTVSRDGYTDILQSKLKIYSRDPIITVEIFGADLCTNQPSYTTDEFFSGSRSGMTSTYSTSPALDIVGRTGVVKTSTTNPATVTTSGSYKGSTCTSTSARRVITARSNVYDQTFGRYAYNFQANAGAAFGFANGFRIRALGTTNGSNGTFVSADPTTGATAARNFGIEVGYPRQDNGNAGASSTYADLSFPFVPDCDFVASTQRVILWDDDNNNASVQSGTRFKVRIYRTSPNPGWLPITATFGSSGTQSAADANGYYTVTAGDSDYAYLSFAMAPSSTYRFYIQDLYQDNTLQMSLPGTSSTTLRSCPIPASLSGVKIDDATGVVPYGGNQGTAGNAATPYYGLTTKVAAVSGTANPFNYTNAVKVRNFNGTAATISLTSAIPAGWVLKGHSICRDDGGVTCTSAYLTAAANIKGPGVKSFSHNFLSGARYQMRWIFSRVVSTRCAQPPIFDPTFPELWEPFNLTTGMTYSNPAYAPVNPRIAMTIRRGLPPPAAPGVVAYATNTQTPTQSGANTSYRYTGINFSAQPVGPYTATWVYTDSLTPAITCYHTFYMGNKPFFHVLGGDFWVGGGGDLSDLQSWNIDNIPASTNGFDNRWGARSDFASIVSGDIKNFATGARVYFGINVPEALAFSNEAAYVNRSNGLYGGHMEAVPPRTDYYEIVEPTATAAVGVVANGRATVNVGTLASGVYKYTGDIGVYGTVPAGRNITIISDGKVTMSSLGGANIAYAPYTIDQIPRLNVFTKDNDIMVSAGVREIHGLLSTGPGGNFYSCAFEPASGPTDPIEYSELAGNLASFTIYAICNNQLRVYGSVQAEEIILTRTFDSLRRPSSNAAEVFTYSPEMWLAKPIGTGTSGSVDLNSYIGLPPVL